jgi:hypothetical protein
VLVAANVISATIFKVSNDCNAFQMGTSVYHFAAGTFAADTINGPATNMFFSPSNFLYAAADEGLFKYTATAYSSVLANTFKKNKQIWTTSNGIVVFSWADPDAGAGNNVVYDV